MENLLSRRPIFLSDGRLQAYEVAFSAGAEKYLVSEEERKKLPDEVLNYMFGFVGNEMLRKRPAFVQVDPSLLAGAPIRTLARQNVTLFLPQPLELTDALSEALGDLKHAGFKLAFGDYAVDDGYEHLLDYAHFIIVNYSQRDEKRRRITPKYCHSKRIKVMAYELQSRAEYEQARKLEYDLFHGPYFSEPALIEKDQLPPVQGNFLELLVEVNRMDINYDKVAGIIGKVKKLDDLLLEHVNSPQFKVQQKITTANQAMTFIGVMRFRRWAAVSAAAVLGQRDMPEQVLLCVARGRFLETVGYKLGGDDLPDNLFTVGLDSLVACFFHRPLTELLGTIPLDRSIRGALLGDEGRLKTALELAAATEVGDWAAIEKHAETLKLQGLDISSAYFDALQWARSTVAEYHID